MDTLVFDIETQNFFTDPGVGRDNFGALKISVVGVYSYAQDKSFCYTEHEMEELAKLFRESERIVGFSINRFGLPVLAKYFDFNLMRLSRLDLLDEIELALGHRISLDILARANLGIGKTHHALEAIDLYRAGNIEELKNYWLRDLKLTKELYDLARKQGYLSIPHKITGELVRASFNWHEQLLPATLF